MIDVLTAPRAELSRAFIAATGALACVVGPEGRIELVNPALEHFTGRSAAELIGKTFWDVWVPIEHVSHVRRTLELAFLGGQSFAVEGDWIAGGGVRRRVAMQNSVLRGSDGRPYAIASVGIDVTEIHRRATTDSLTGTANRGALFDGLSKMLHPDRGRGCGVLFCDLDGFKAVNDEQGHLAGDRLLVEVARRLMDLAGPDNLVARLGGDEFVVVFDDAEPADMPSLAERAVACVQDITTTAAGAVSLRVSVGQAFGDPGERPDDVLARADHGMYRNKGLRRKGP